ncbi:MAG: T9SS type A sorting domain-containing protein [Candidatus Kapaibacterium sp.]
MWAQEFYNRGFDFPGNANGVSTYWERYLKDVDEGVYWITLEGGYNRNAVYYQRIFKQEAFGEAGVSQIFRNNTEVPYDFYVYARGEETVGEVKVKILSEDSDTLHKMSIGHAGQTWTKLSGTIPLIEGHKRVKLVIYFEGSGRLDLDEASIMPADNINGIRREYYDLFMEWQPTAMRYPGGWFVEYSSYRWEMAVGAIDQRRVNKGFENERLDFGIHEFIDLCRDIGAEPHITVYFLNSVPSESAAIVEYCNSSQNTPYGGLRADHGHPEPYDVKIWEIGNEIWENPSNYGSGFVDHYKAMKAVDPSITCIISGDIWHGKSFVDTILTEVGSDCDVYGWHWAHPQKPIDQAEDEDLYLTQMCGNLVTEDMIDSVYQWMREHGVEDEMTQGITEIWSEYNADGYEWGIDTARRGGSLENGLWMASQYNSVIRKSDKVEIMEKTFACHTLRKFNIDGRRIYYRTPSYLACLMARHHVGSQLVESEVICSDYDVPEIRWMFRYKNVPYLDVAATKTEDSLFINFLNKHPRDSMKTFINLYGKTPDVDVIKYSLESESYLDANTPADPDKIKVRRNTITLNNVYTFPPHSFTILAVPIDKIVSVSEDEKMEKISVGPNPFNEYINIAIREDSTPFHIGLYDNQGRLVKEFAMHNQGQRVSTAGLSEGIYFLRVISNKFSSTIPLVKSE